MKKVLFGLLSVVLLSTAACKKSKDAPALTKENVAGSYKLDKITFKFGSSEQDITDTYLEDCSQDDVMTFKADLTYESVDAGQTCGGDYSGTWDIPAASKFDLDGDVYDVTTWNGSTLAIGEPFDFGGQNGTIIIYLNKQ
jgi:hypothetical protein